LSSVAYEAADCGLLSPDLAAGIRRVKGAKKHGVRLGNWLSLDYWESLKAHAVPLDEGHIARLSHSALALDIYSWLANRFAVWPNVQRLRIVHQDKKQ
jgi:hypothetical protein